MGESHLLHGHDLALELLLHLQVLLLLWLGEHRTVDEPLGQQVVEGLVVVGVVEAVGAVQSGQPGREQCS